MKIFFKFIMCGTFDKLDRNNFFSATSNLENLIEGWIIKFENKTTTRITKFQTRFRTRVLFWRVNALPNDLKLEYP